MIEPGKLGDLVVVGRDYLTCPEDEIRNIRPVMTILNGRVVYDARWAARKREMTQVMGCTPEVRHGGKDAVTVQ